MKSIFKLVLAAAVISPFTNVQALDENAQFATLSKSGVSIFKSNGEISWSYKTKKVDDVQLIKNGNVLFADSSLGVVEVSPAKEGVFEYHIKGLKEGGAMSCLRLADGNTVIGSNSDGKILIVSPEGKVVKEIQTPHKPHNHGNMRDVKVLPNGNFMVCHKGGGLAEYDDVGKVVWKSKLKGNYYVSHLTEHDTIITTMLTKVVELDRDSNVLWELNTADLKEGYIGKMCGLSVLTNGNLVISFYKPFDKKSGDGIAVVEINRKKEIVWQYPAESKKNKYSAGVNLSVFVQE